MANHKPLTLTSPTQRQGGHFEQHACAFLQAQGLVLIAQNWQQPKVGELDLIMLEVGQAWSTLVFIEVRQRQRSGFGDAALSVTPAKQGKIIKAARYFLQQHPKYAQYECRFDVIAYNTAKGQRLTQVIDSSKSKNANVNNGGASLKSHPLDNQHHQPEWLQGAFIATAWS